MPLTAQFNGADMSVMKTTVSLLSTRTRSTSRPAPPQIHKIIPAINPRPQEFLMRRFDNLKAACAGFVEPACSIFDVVGHHAPVTRKPFTDSLRITVSESFDDHEEHAEESTQF